MFRKILHANDGSDHAFEALSLAMRIARQDAAELHMVSVEETAHVPEPLERAGNAPGTADRCFHRVVERAHAMAQENRIQLHAHVLSGHPVRRVTDLAAELEVDLIVVGSSGHSALYDRMIGSRAQKILHHARCPVLVVK